MTRRRRTNTGIPGLSFSWRRATGISRAKYRFARATGIPTTRSGRQRKLGRMVTAGGCLLRTATVAVVASAMALLVFAWLR